MSTEATITVAGQQFKAVTNASLEHDIYTMQQVHRCGAENVIMGADETAPEYVHRVLLSVTADGRVFDLLGCLLMPAELATSHWTAELAHATGRTFATVTTPEDKRTVHGQIVEALSGFFERGLLSLRTFQKSLSSVDISPKSSETTADTASTAPGQS